MDTKPHELSDMKMTPEQYLQVRVENQLAWYSKRSAQNKSAYFQLQIVALLAAVLIPILSLSSGDIKVRIAVALLGGVAALIAGLLSLYQFRDQWLDYRSTAESLKCEKHLFLTRSPPYAKADAFPLFVQRVEAIILAENNAWQQKTFDLAKSELSDDEPATPESIGRQFRSDSQK